MSLLLNKKQPARNTYTPVRRPVPTTQRLKKAPAVAQAPRAPLFDMAGLRKFAVWLGGIGLVLTVFLGLSMGLMKAYQYCTTSEYFAIADITVEGVNQLKPADIIAASGLQKGSNSLLAHIPDMEKKVLANPWVSSVTIRRELPGRFVIQVTERTPQFWVLRNNSMQYLDGEGSIIAPVESANFRSLPTLDIGPGGEEAMPMLPEFMTKIRNTALPFDPSQISWLRVSAGKGFELYWESKQLSLSIGMENWQDNLRRMGMVIKDLEKRKEIGMVREIRAADGQVWLQKA